MHSLNERENDVRNSYFVILPLTARGTGVSGQMTGLATLPHRASMSF